MAIDAHYSPFFRNSMTLSLDGNTTNEVCDLAFLCSRLGPDLEEFQAYSNALPAYIDLGMLPAQHMECVPLPRKRFRGIDEQCSRYYGGMELNQQNLGLINDPLVSTSGRDPLNSLKELESQLLGQQLDINQLILSQAEQIRQGLQAKRQKHTRNLFELVEKRFESILKGKEEELQRLCKRNAELEQLARDFSQESNLWQNMARSQDSLALDLMASLERAQYAQSKEGYGDSEAESAICPSAEQSSASLCFPKLKGKERAERMEETRMRSVCRVCRKKDVCMLILPCRHLCLCRDCEQVANACPLCKSQKNASVEVYLE